MLYKTTGRRITAILILAMIVGSCYQKTPDKYADMLHALEGEWQEAPGIGYREVWKKNSYGLKGEGFMHSGNSFSKIEDISIFIKDTTLVYGARVESQNEGRIILFSLKSHSDTSLVFMNEHHDFPNIIAYHLSTDTVLQVHVQSLSEPERDFSLTLKKTGN